MAAHKALTKALDAWIKSLRSRWEVKGNGNRGSGK